MCFQAWRRLDDVFVVQNQQQQHAFSNLNQFFTTTTWGNTTPSAAALQQDSLCCRWSRNTKNNEARTLQVINTGTQHLSYCSDAQ